MMHGQASINLIMNDSVSLSVSRAIRRRDRQAVRPSSRSGTKKVCGTMRVTVADVQQWRTASTKYLSALFAFLRCTVVVRLTNV